MHLSAQMVALINLAENGVLESSALLAWYEARLAIATGCYKLSLTLSLAPIIGIAMIE